MRKLSRKKYEGIHHREEKNYPKTHGFEILKGRVQKTLREEGSRQGAETKKGGKTRKKFGRFRDEVPRVFQQGQCLHRGSGKKNQCQKGEELTKESSEGRRHNRGMSLPDREKS